MKIKKYSPEPSGEKRWFREITSGQAEAYVAHGLPVFVTEDVE
jgi:hypothetical protein